MSVYSTFLYGESVYGPTIVGAVNAEIIGDNIIVLYFDSELAVNGEYLDKNNYAISIFSGDGHAISVLAVLPPQSVVTDRVYLQTDYHTNGTVYTISVSGLVSRDGSSVSASFTVASRATKLDSIYSNLPSHFSRDPNSLIRNILVAISQSDDRIGGSRDDLLP